MGKKVYIYTRVSTKLQVEGYSLEAQETRLEQYAKSQNMQIVGRYSDEGFSGKNVGGRPNFQRMLNDIECRKDNVDLVLVYKLSRFGRNVIDVLNSLEHLERFNCGLVCSDEPIDSTSAMGKLIIAILAAVAEMERENILMQTMAGRIQKAADGKWNGGFAPYGYKLVDGELIVAEEEAEAIRLIFDKFAHTSLGYTGVTKYLQEHGIKKIPRENGYLTSFSKDFVKDALDNPIYVGKIAYGRRKSEKKEGTRNEYHVVEQKEYGVYPGVHEAIIDEETWKIVREKRKATAKRLEKKNDLGHAYQLAGIVKCPVCGKGLVGNPNRKKRADGTLYKIYYTYRCNHKDGLTGHKCTFSIQPSEEKINKAVQEVITKLVSNSNFANKIKDLIDAKVDVTDIDNDCIRLQAQVKQYLEKKKRIATQIDELDILDDSYEMKQYDLQNRLEKMYEKISESERALEKACEKRDKVRQEQLTGEKVYQYLMVFGKVIDRCSDEEKKIIYNLLIEEAQIFDKEQENGRWIKSIKFRFPVYYRNDIIDCISWDENPTVETVVLLTQQVPDNTVEIELDMEDFDATSAETKATYEQIKEYIFAKYDTKVSTLCIAQVKKEFGLPMRECCNKGKEGHKVPQVTKQKRELIIEALKYYQMI